MSDINNTRNGVDLCPKHGKSRRAGLPFARPEKNGLYDPALERDACGVGVVANIDGSRSHTVVSQALQVLINLGHRGACGCDPETGDGAGILIQLPHAFFKKEARSIGIELPEAGHYGVGIVFLPRDPVVRDECEDAILQGVAEENLKFLGWRDVPVSPEAIGTLARETMPVIRQFFLGAPEGMATEALERKLYLARKEAERLVAELAIHLTPHAVEDFYISSCSARTIVYKGLLMAQQLANFYTDLNDPATVSAFGLVHSRFSTNTLGEWKLAHPYRYLAHNGEINTVRGNRNWMTARERALTSGFFGKEISKLTPVCAPRASDSASFDNVFELIAMGGRDVDHVAAMMLPEAWFGHEEMPQEGKDFYEYHGCLMEPWDGPALIAFTDGRKVGAVLDRNGLRPFRYTVTKDGLLVMGSETGVLEIAPERIEYRARLQPGRMFLLDLEEGRIIRNREIKHRLASRKPYGAWLKQNRVILDELPAPKPSHVPGTDLDTLVTRQQVFGYSQEDLNFLMTPMAIDGNEPTGSMGNDAALAVLSDRPQNLFAYFKQLFAQVSNPPLDYVREALVTQLSVPVGTEQNLFDETPEHARVLRIDHPILQNADLSKIKGLDLPGLRSRIISTLFPVAEGVGGLRKALDRIRREADDAVAQGYSIIVLSDRGVDAQHTYVPSLLAVGGIHHHMIRERTRTSVDIVVESGEPREVHHFAALFGYGASAINPYLAFETLAGLCGHQHAEDRAMPDKDVAEYNYIKAVEKGVLKVMSKMGISTLEGYQGAQIFEAVGLSQALVDEFFTWTPTRIQGIGLDEIAVDLLDNHQRAYPKAPVPGRLPLDIGGLYQWRGTGEKHLYTPEVIALLQEASRRNHYDLYKQFETAANDETGSLATIRGLLDFKIDPDGEVPLEEVESAESIVTRFATGAISLGSISREAHETLAIAMNRLGARSNTGEGGEDPTRFTPDPNGDSRSSRMKQVASGRFGVTTEYLVNATDLQIKMAQGSKPGEGGQIPGYKISEYIAQVRHTTPGVELISPPPHHDIYSIEDLAQLIHDLKNVNPAARIHVKLVSEAGVGIIAAGVSKAHADVVLISGDSGGTGASPLSSIKHGGLPWELGLAETQQVLVANGLRGRIVVQTDGQIKTARDVAIATLLGAEEWGVATAALVVLGCIMLRKCHLNTCSVGIATQDPQLRKLFAGTPEALCNYFLMLSESLREYMAKLGFRTVDEMVGRVDKLEPRRAIEHWKASGLDFSALLTTIPPAEGVAIHHYETQDHGLENALDHQLIEVASQAILRQEPVTAEFEIHNPNRVVGAMMSGKIAELYGNEGLPDGTIKFTFKGSAGQSFGAFLTAGATFRLEGDSNDYFAKGLSGGRIVVVPPAGSTFPPEENIIIGNVALYGATGGEAFIRGIAGERFGVRNSGARAVIEGIGDHGCEYMTGGVVVVIGPTGRNFAAGMSGGVAYVWDPDATFINRFNPAMADLEQVEAGSLDEIGLKGLLEHHESYTGSTVAARILDDWERSRALFKKIMPRDYARALRERAERVATGAEEIVRHG
ncbi:MAG TPA: glutamate synthase large subunit [Dehalococcoidia bacterium]|nr:glutamate synthase large subunit [Dehalococcoidia bacterium]